MANINTLVKSLRARRGAHPSGATSLTCKDEILVEMFNRLKLSSLLY